MPNPYPWILNAADAIIVTADSVNMTSEAACTRKPVYVAELKPESGRVALFHKPFRKADIPNPSTSYPFIISFCTMIKGLMKPRGLPVFS